MLRKKWLPEDKIKGAFSILIYKGQKELDLYLASCNLSRSEKSKVKKAILEAKNEG